MTSLTYTVTPDDYIAYNVHLAAKPHFVRRFRIRSLLSGAIFLVSIAVVLTLILGMPDKGFPDWMPLFMGLVLLVEGVMWAAARPLQRAQVRVAVRAQLGPAPSGTFLGPHRMEAASDALHSNGPMVRSIIAWPAVRTLEETPDHLFIVLGGAQSLIVPKRDLAPEALLAFKAAIEAGMRDARR